MIGSSSGQATAGSFDARRATLAGSSGQVTASSKRRNTSENCLKPDGRLSTSSQPNLRLTTAGATKAVAFGDAPSTKPNTNAVHFSKLSPEEVAQEMRAVEADIAALKRLLNDMRENIAAVISHHLLEASRGGGGREAIEWGSQCLRMLVSEDFAKATLKGLQKSMPQAKFNT